MLIIDSQQHEFGPQGNWDTLDQSTRWALVTEILLAWMDAVGVAGTLIYPQDRAWCAEAVAARPDRLASVLKIRDPEAADVEAQVAKHQADPGVIALRIAFGAHMDDPGGEAAVKVRTGAYDRFLDACEQAGLPLFCSAHGTTPLVGELARSRPKLRLIIDHLGIGQPPMHPREANPWHTFGDLVALGKYENVAVKLSGLPVLSNEDWPYADVWPHMRKLVDAFGAGRIMWASDIAKFEGRIGWTNRYPVAHDDYKGKHTFAAALASILYSDKLTQREKELILGGTVVSFLGWSPKVREKAAAT